LVLKKDSLHFSLQEKQGGLCPLCGGSLIDADWDEPIHVHHLVPRSEGGSDTITNLMLLHEECHYAAHRECTDESLEARLKALLSPKP